MAFHLSDVVFSCGIHRTSTRGHARETGQFRFIPADPSDDGRRRRRRRHRRTAVIVIDVVFSLTNYHVMLHPLRAQDGEYYSQVLAELKVKGKEAKNNGARRQREYRLRQASVRAALEGVDDDQSSR